MDVIECPQCGAGDINDFDMDTLLCLECGLTFPKTESRPIPV